MKMFRMLLLFLLSMVSASASWAQQYTPAERQALQKTAPALLEDPDGDGIPSGLDRCPTEAGASGSGGCPVSAPAPSPAPAAATKAATDWKAAVDALRQNFYAALDRALTEGDKRLAVQRFGDEVRHGLGITSAGGLEYAIAPVIKTRTAGNPALGALIAEAWNGATGYPYSSILAFMAEADRLEIEKQRKEAYATAQPATAAPAPAAKSPCNTPGYMGTLKFRKGMTVARSDGWAYVIDSFDCTRDQYLLTNARTQEKTEIAGVLFRPAYTEWKGGELPQLAPIIKSNYYTCAACHGSGKVQVGEESSAGGPTQIGNTNYYLNVPRRTDVRWVTTTCQKCRGTGRSSP